MTIDDPHDVEGFPRGSLNRGLEISGVCCEELTVGQADKGDHLRSGRTARTSRQLTYQSMGTLW